MTFPNIRVRFGWYDFPTVHWDFNLCTMRVCIIPFVLFIISKRAIFGLKVRCHDLASPALRRAETLLRKFQEAAK